MIFMNQLVLKGRELKHYDIEHVHPPQHIKKGRSASELWDKIFFGGEPQLPEAIATCLELHNVFKGFDAQLGIPEHNTDFDRYGKGRQHDLMVLGVSMAGQCVIGVEAKVDETFGDSTVEEYLNSGITLLLQGKNSYKPERIRDLVDALFKDHRKAEADKLRYQLVQATAGVLAEAKSRDYNYALFVIYNLVPKNRTEDYDYRSKINTNDLDAFISILSDCKYTSLPTGQITGPITVPGNEHIPSDIPLYMLKVEDIFE